MREFILKCSAYPDGNGRCTARAEGCLVRERNDREPYCEPHGTEQAGKLGTPWSFRLYAWAAAERARVAR